MRRTPVGILCALFAPVAFASQASSQPRDPYYVPYLSANAIAPPALYPPAPYYAPPNYYASATRPYGPPQYGYQSPAPSSYPAPEPQLIPLRPRSCGEYRYWNGDYCADARYERPYVGPR